MKRKHPLLVATTTILVVAILWHSQLVLDAITLIDMTVCGASVDAICYRAQGGYTGPFLCFARRLYVDGKIASLERLVGKPAAEIEKVLDTPRFREGSFTFPDWPKQTALSNENWLYYVNDEAVVLSFEGGLCKSIHPIKQKQDKEYQLWKANQISKRAKGMNKLEIVKYLGEPPRVYPCLFANYEKPPRVSSLERSWEYDAGNDIYCILSFDSDDRCVAVFTTEKRATKNFNKLWWQLGTTDLTAEGVFIEYIDRAR